jgi:hypothetical protein
MAWGGSTLIDRLMMVKIYSGIIVGIIALAAGVADGSAFLIVLGLVATFGSALLAFYFRRRRAEGHSVP